MKSKYRKIERYLQILNSERFYNVQNVENVYVCPSDYKVGHNPPPIGSFAPYEKGAAIAGGLPDKHEWYHFTVNVTGDVSVDPFQLNLTCCGKSNTNDPQFIIYVNGELKQGLDANHTYYTFKKPGVYDIYLYAYTGKRSAVISFRTAKERIPPIPIPFTAHTRRVRTAVNDLYFDIKVAFDALKVLKEDSAEYALTLYHLDKAVSRLDLYSVGSEEFFASVSDAGRYMTEEFYGKYCSEQPTTVACIASTHIDCAWLWTLKQSREKVQRSFSTALALMDEYPEYRFMSSQPCLYKMLKEEAPEVYEKVKSRIADGRWECEGAMWVEADCNLTSGESLVRQILYGKRFFKEEFGKDSRVLWLPDVFGYSAALPQILKKSGVDWFVTSKIAWNDTNAMPYETFSWQGIDGTRINTYFMTAKNSTEPQAHATYNGNTDPDMVMGTYKFYSQKSLSNEAMLTYGYGDGGGGPTAEHIEAIRRENYGIPGIPNTKIDSVGDFLSRLGDKIENSAIPIWRGELYLEFHRGTYTSQSKNKKFNRQCEFLYEDAELMSVLAQINLGEGFPKDILRKGWETILTNQFHDIIPGSSIEPVYRQSDIDYSIAIADGKSIRDSKAKKLAASLDRSHGYIGFNPHSFDYPCPVDMGGKTAIVSGIAPKGYSPVSNAVTDCSVKVDLDSRTAETQLYFIEFDQHWQISRLYDKLNRREVLRQGEVGNEIRIYPDYPDTYDAWEWSEYSLDTYRAMTAVERVEAVSDGARRGIVITRPYGSSRLTQTIWFYDVLPRIEFHTVVDQREKHLMVKAAFPVRVNSDKATYEIQFGTVERPTHKNTSWERAKFEVCGHKYADLSDGGYGVALINDCKYGHDIHDGVMQLSLFRCPAEPDPTADQGELTFTYAICPHAGTLASSDVVYQAYTLNYPISVIPASGDCDSIPCEFSAIDIRSDHVICETVKNAEDGDGIIFRLYEFKNMSDEITLTFGFDVKEVFICDLLENEECSVATDGRSVTLPIGNFEIISLKVIK